MKSYLPRAPISSSASEKLQMYPEFLRALLYYRGIDTEELAEKFLNPSYDDHTHNPFLIAGMEKAVKRILGAIKNKERIVIYSDYDHDGIPGGVILYEFFKKIGYENFSNYIPHRYTEGYGLNEKAVESFKEEGTQLIITVDCGISDIGSVKKANDLNIDVIITDHHLTHEILPSAFVILNSKQDHCAYPFDMLCGAAVAFKLVQALLMRGDFGVTVGWEKWLLDLVGLSTIADMVPLVGENRVLARFGLTVLRKTRRPGLLKLMRRMRISPQHLTEDDVGFMIAPRINAASRMSDPRLAFNLLTSTDEDGMSDAFALELEKLNSARKGVVASMVKEMKHTLKERKPVPSIIVMGNPSWRPGLLGLAANSILEEHARPVFLWGREGGTSLKGSCRSDGSVDVVKLMKEVPPGVFVEYGGHTLSGGFSIYPEKVHYLEGHLKDAYEKTRKRMPEEKIFIDKKLSVNDADLSLFEMISLLAPFGLENPKPLFLFENEIVDQSREFGKSKEHVELTFKKSNGSNLKAIAFFGKTDFKQVNTGEKISFVGNLEVSYFNRFPELRLRIIDIL